MPGTDVARIDLVIAEILARQRPVLVTNQAVFCHGGRVELDLYLDILRNGQQRRGHLVYQCLARLAQGVDIGIVTVADIGQLLHQVVVVVAAAKPQGRQTNTARAPLLDQLLQHFKIDGTDIEITVGRQDDTVNAVLDKGLLRQSIGQPDSGTPIGRAPGRQPIQRRRNRGDLVPWRGFEHHTGGTGIDDDRDPVF